MCALLLFPCARSPSPPRKGAAALCVLCAGSNVTGLLADVSRVTSLIHQYGYQAAAAVGWDGSGAGELVGGLGSWPWGCCLLLLVSLSAGLITLIMSAISSAWVHLFVEWLSNQGLSLAVALGTAPCWE